MGEVKPGWQRVKFGDVVRQVKDKVPAKESGLDRYIAGEHMDTDDLKIRRWGEINDDYLGPAFHIRFKPGHVLYGSRRTYLRKVAVADFEGICANTTFVVESKKPDVLLPELLPFIMTTEAFHAHSKRESKGSVNPYVNFSDLAWYEFALPPLEEQRRIARALQKFEANIVATRAAHGAALLQKWAISENFVTQHSEMIQLDAVLKSTTYGSSTRASLERTDGAIPILRIPNVLRDEVELDDLKYVQLSPVDREKYTVKSGDVLIVRTNGNPDYVGRAVACRHMPESFVYASYLIRLRLDENRMLPRYVVAMLNSPSIRRRIRGSVRSSAGNFNLNTQGIRRQRIPLVELNEQRALVEQLDDVSQAVRALDDRLRAVSQLNRSFLEEALA